MSRRPYVIFASERSGSSTLCRILNTHPALSCVHEPFNAKNHTASVTPSTPDQMRWHLDAIRDQFTGIKHVWWLNGFPLRSRELNVLIATHGEPLVIYLDRRNVLKRAVSRFIADQTNTWYLKERSGPNREKLTKHQFPPIDKEWLTTYLRRLADESRYYRDAVSASAGDRIDLWYEELYEAPKSTDERLHSIERVLAFLGESITPVQRYSAEHLLDPAVSKLASDDVYYRIPNIEEIDAEFGGSEYGHLFADDTSDAEPRHLNVSRRTSGPSIDTPAEVNTLTSADYNIDEQMRLQSHLARTFHEKRHSELLELFREYIESSASRQTHLETVLQSRPHRVASVIGNFYRTLRKHNP